MKKVCYFVLLGLICYGFSCNTKSSSDKGYVLSGKIVNAGIEKLYLEELIPSEFIVIDTTTLADDGTFKMKGYIAEPGFYRLRIGEKKNEIIMVLDNKPIEVYIDVDNILDYTITGSTDSRLLKDQLIAINNTYQQTQELQKKLQSSKFLPNFDSINKSIQDEYRTLVEKQINEIKIFIDTSSSIVAIYVTNFLNPDQDMPYLKSLVPLFQKRFPDSKHTKLFTERMNALKILAIGEPVPDIALPNPDGDTITLSSLKGNIVLLDFWAAWCRPCRMANPGVVKLYKQYKDKGFEVYSVSLDKKKETWVKTIEQDQLIWKSHVSDLKGWRSSAAQTYKVSSIPNTFLIDKEGKLIAKNLHGESLALKLQELLK